MYARCIVPYKCIGFVRVIASLCLFSSAFNMCCVVVRGTKKGSQQLVVVLAPMFSIVDCLAGLAGQPAGG